MWRARKRGQRPLCALVGALALVLIGAAVLASVAEALPADFWGVVPQATPTEEQIQRLKQGGVESIRVPISWAAAQPSRGGPFTWSAVDPVVAEASSAGINVLPFVYGAPSWAVRTKLVDRRNGVSAPANLPVAGSQGAGWNAFLEAVVDRYGPNGSFWAANPSLPRMPIRTWQIWNEPNFKYFVAQPNPVEYGKLVKISSTAIKAVDPGAKIILGGLFSQPNEAIPKVKHPPAYFATDFLTLMYRGTPAIKTKFNGVALHPYTYRYQRLTPEIEEVRAVLAANHDAGKSLWITELGWSSEPPNGSNGFAKGIGGQRAQLTGAFSLLERMQARWKIQRVYWFSIDDQAGSCNFCDGSGLFGAGFVPKPSWSAYVRFAGGVAG